MLCYYVVNGDQDNLTSIKVERWAENNPNTILGKTIKEMNKRHRERNKAMRETQKKAFSLFETDH